MATIRDNVERVLAALGIVGIEITDERPDRVFGFDTRRELAAACSLRKDHWMTDAYDPLHGKSVIKSCRERTTPSMQVCFHRVSDLSPSRRDWYFVEIDLDHAPPSNPETILIHGEEVLVNALTHGLTDQDDMAKRLDARFTA